MDGAGYVRASLLGMSQGISHLHDPLRLHPALHGVQVSEANKDASPLMRPLSDYGHLPFMGFTPHFLHHTLDHRLPLPSAFHPLSHKPVSGGALQAPTPCSSASIHSSAFSPLPNKNAKLEADTGIVVPASSAANIFSQGMLAIDARNALFGGLSPPGMNAVGMTMGDDRRDSPSPRGSHGSRDSPAHARDADTPNSTGEDSRGRKLRPGESWCPVCSTPIRASEFEAHLGLELEKLGQLLSERSAGPGSVPRSSPNSGPNIMHGPMSPVTNHRARDPGYDTYERVRSNRLNRMRTKRKRPGRVEDLACPVCSERSIAPEDFNQHMEQCLRRGALPQLPPLSSGLYLAPSVSRSDGGLSLPPRCGGPGASEDEVVDVEGDGPMDDYQWPGGRPLRGAPRPPSANQRDADSSDKDQQQNPRAPVSISSDTGVNGACGDGGGGVEDLEQEMQDIKDKRINDSEVENNNTKQRFSCLVCRSEYKRPAVSVVCWHVMCEGCWSTTLGVKTECPQCFRTMAAEDVRPIHL